MAILTYPLDGIIYNAEEVETYLCTRTSGIFASDGHFPASVTGTREVTIGPGLAWMQNEEYHGKAIYNPEDVVLEIPEADAYQTRIDRIVLQFDQLLKLTQLIVKEGTPSSSPVPPDIERDSLIYELGLYTVTVPASSVAVSESNVASTVLDESVCGIMRDGVTGIPTQELYDQWYAFFEQAVSDTEAFENQFNVWFADIKEQAEQNMADNQKEFESWMGDTQEEYDDWFDNLEYVLDGDVAGHLEVGVENAQDTASEALDQLATGWVTGFITDGDGNALLADDSDDEYGITMSRPICNCDTTDEILSKVYPVGAIYMSINDIDPGVLFGGTWARIENCFLLAAGTHSAGSTGGAETATLSESNLPSHTHSIPSHAHSIPSHTHSFSGTTGSTEHSHSNYVRNGTFSSGSSNSYTIATAATAQETWGTCIFGGAHTHTFSGTTGSYSGTTGSYSGTSGATGSGTAFSTMPPYIAVYMWQRTA